MTTARRVQPDPGIVPVIHRPEIKDDGPVTITVEANVVVKLTAPQAQLLRFFADQIGPPVLRPSMYDALAAQGLIQRENPSQSYRITELGRQVFELLDRG